MFVYLFRVLLDPSQYKVIHSLEEDDVEPGSSGGGAAPTLECQFEDAVEKGFQLVIVEPPGLGDNCIRWIRAGNFLHKAAVLSAIGTLIATPFVPRKISFFTTFPLGVFSIGCAGMYGVSWQFDPCCKYQVDYKGQELTKVPSHDIHTSSPVILVRRNDRFRKILHNSLSFAVAGYLGWILYKHFSS